ncbi:hypothetical protein K6119_16895 [Paracrocinitomix mangrovi]|uniref:toxin-antitoxin system YwqK family antitoxin n=1 Tax=Paracrocinitomix mangrovi TaxID=2862509 RepID=UPI001C8EA0A2|nr:hypothetical protein [Paracrocinitomix mangrovi]UKN01406.1 hypothetical protein K6119_16895 [Paracrocinitomix mangrovi]
MGRLLILISILITTVGFAQQPQQKYNQTDAQGRKQGVWKKAYDNTQVFRYVGQFKNDIPVGEFTYYYESGEVQAKIVFSDNGKTTRSKMYHESGYLMALGKYVNEQKDSIWVYFDDKGRISYQETYKNDKLNGQKVYFYAPKDGQYPVSRYEYYKDGVLDGEFKEFHQNMQIKAKGQYKDGNLHGAIVYYYSNGKIMKTCNYKYAVKHGPWAFYNESGQLVGTKMYWEGKLMEGKQVDEKMAIWKAQHSK